MKLKVFLITFVALLLTAPGAAYADRCKEEEPSQQVERSAEADSSVSVEVCLLAGNISVQGWSKNEVVARSKGTPTLELKRVDGMRSGPATKLEVLMPNQADSRAESNDCQPFGDVELMVPRGASVHLQTADGTISVSEVASVYARSQQGDVAVEKATRSVEATSFTGDVSINDSTGRMTLKSVGGDVEASGLGPNDSADSFEASTISGDIDLDRISHSQVNAKTVNGTIHLNGPLVHRGQYGFNTTTGNVMLALPGDASFRLDATLSQEGEIISDFALTSRTETSSMIVPGKTAAPPLRAAPPAPPEHVASPESPVTVTVEQNGQTITVKPIVKVKVAFALRRVTAVHGTGDATITVASFSGNLHLNKS